MKYLNWIMRKRVFGGNNYVLVCFSIFTIIFLVNSQAFSQERIMPKKRKQGIVPGQYIVTFHNYIREPGAVAERLGKLHKFGVQHVYRRALKGFSASMPEAVVERLKRDPDVALIEPDRLVYAVGQEIPTGVDRIEADLNATAKIDGIDGEDERVDVDVAIIDTGIDLDHPDLNVVASTKCSRFGGCLDGQGNDDNGHGSHVAGIVGALDNNIGVVGVAPGARLWAVKVLNSSGSGYLSWIIAGIDWVTAHADQIEVANMSLGGQGYSQAARNAIKNAIDAGVVITVAAGNDSHDIFGLNGNFGDNDDFCPACYPEVAAISAMCDTDGEAGGTGTPGSYGTDDSFASFSNFSQSVLPENPVTSPGGAIDLLLPGVDILSTYRNGGYAVYSGTSMASPHAAGLAALYIAENGRAGDAEGVYAIRQALIDAGVEQDDDINGLRVFNDPDSNWERLGWAAGSATLANDIAVKTISATPDSVFPNYDVIVTVEVKNNGTEIFTHDYYVSVESDNATPNDETDDFTIYESPLIIDDLASGASNPPLTFSWTAPYIIGHHVLTATVTYGYEDENPNNDVKSTSVEIMDPATPTTMHIAELTGSSRWYGRVWFWRIWEATVDIFVEDNLGNPVDGVTVTISWSDGSIPPSKTTSNGWCQFKGYQFQGTPGLTLTVETISHPDLTDEGSSGTSIYIPRP